MKKSIENFLQSMYFRQYEILYNESFLDHINEERNNKCFRWKRFCDSCVLAPCKAPIFKVFAAMNVNLRDFTALLL